MTGDVHVDGHQARWTAIDTYVDPADARKAALMVAARARDHAEAALLLDMLGLHPERTSARE